MSEQEQQIAIAEACGWLCLGGCFAADYPGWILQGDTAWKGGMRKLPNYLHDLNAMHEAEKTLDAHRREQYTDLCVIIASRKAEFTAELSETSLRWNALHCTAPQRAEAFLRTVGKWGES